MPGEIVAFESHLHLSEALWCLYVQYVTYPRILCITRFKKRPAAHHQDATTRERYPSKDGSPVHITRMPQPGRYIWAKMAAWYKACSSDGADHRLTTLEYCIWIEDNLWSCYKKWGLCSEISLDRPDKLIDPIDNLVYENGNLAGELPEADLCDTALDL